MDLKPPAGGRRNLWLLLLLVPYVAMFWVGSYNRIAPEWGGIPFFYWYQLLWIPIAAVLTLLVYFLIHRAP